MIKEPYEGEKNLPRGVMAPDSILMTILTWVLELDDTEPPTWMKWSLPHGYRG